MSLTRRYALTFSPQSGRAVPRTLTHRYTLRMPSSFWLTSRRCALVALVHLSCEPVPSTITMASQGSHGTSCRRTEPPCPKDSTSRSSRPTARESSASSVSLALSLVHRNDPRPPVAALGPAEACTGPG